MPVLVASASIARTVAVVASYAGKPVTIETSCNLIWCSSRFIPSSDHLSPLAGTLNPNDIEFTSPLCMRIDKSRPSVVGGSCASASNPFESSDSLSVPDLVEAKTRSILWLTNNFIWFLDFRLRLNAPGMMYSVNGSGSLGELKTAAYPVNVILSGSISLALISNVTSFVLRSTVDGILFSFSFFNCTLTEDHLACSSSCRILSTTPCAYSIALCAARLLGPDPHNKCATSPGPGY